MTADGILYIDENCRDKFKKELDEAFGKDKWRLDGSNYGYIWNLSEIPPEMEVDVLDNKTDEIIGHIIIENMYEKEYDTIRNCMYLDPYPYEINITKGKEGNK
jgi:hypothetical protein